MTCALLRLERVSRSQWHVRVQSWRTDTFRGAVDTLWKEHRSQLHPDVWAVLRGDAAVCRAVCRQVRGDPADASTFGEWRLFTDAVTKFGMDMERAVQDARRTCAVPGQRTCPSLSGNTLAVRWTLWRRGWGPQRLPPWVVLCPPCRLSWRGAPRRHPTVIGAPTCTRCAHKFRCTAAFARQPGTRGESYAEGGQRRRGDRRHVLLVSARHAREQCIHDELTTPPPPGALHCACPLRQRD